MNTDNQAGVTIANAIYSAYKESLYQPDIPEVEREDCTRCGGFLYIEQGGDTVDCPVCEGDGFEPTEQKVNTDMFTEKIEDIMFHGEFAELFQGLLESVPGPHPSAEAVSEQPITLGLLIGRAIRESDRNTDVVGKDCGIASHMDALIADEIYLNTIPIKLIERLIRLLDIPFRAFRESALVSFQRIKKFESDNRVIKHGWNGLWENEEAYDKYLNRLEELLNQTTAHPSPDAGKLLDGLEKDNQKYTDLLEMMKPDESLEESDAVDFYEWAIGQGFITYSEYMPWHDSRELYQKFISR